MPLLVENILFYFNNLLKLSLDWCIEYFRASVDYFSQSTKNFTETTLEQINTNDSLAVRRVNDRLVQLERFFIDPKGLPDRPETKFV